MRILLIFLVFCSLGVAQTPTRRGTPKKPAAAQAAIADPDSWPIETISIEGIHNFTRDQVLGIAKLRPGQVANKAQLEAAHERLMSSGVFDSVAYKYAPATDGKGVAVTFELAEVSVFYPYLMEDFPGKEADLEAWLKEKEPLFGPKIPATKESLEHYKQLISEYLATKFNDQEPVTAKLSAENPPELVILFRPATQRAVIAQFEAKNTGEVNFGVVQSTLYGVGVGTVYSVPRVQQLLDNSVRPLYEAKGHLRVKFPKIESRPATDVKGLIVTVEIEEGPVFQFGKIRFQGVDNAPDELANLAKIQSGQLANFDDVKAAQSRLAEYFRHNGYLQARAEALRTVDDHKKTVDLMFRIDPGHQFLFHELTIVGLDLESEPVIRKLWGLKEGKPYNPDYPDHFLQRVKEEGIFDNLKDTAAERKINNDNYTVDVTLTFQGGGGNKDGQRRRSPR